MNDAQRAARVEAALNAFWPAVPAGARPGEERFMAAALDAADARIPVVALEEHEAFVARVREAALVRLEPLSEQLGRCKLCDDPFHLRREHHDPRCPLAGTEPK